MCEGCLGLCGSTQAGSEVRHCVGVWKNFLDDLELVLVLWSPCCICGIVCALLVDFRWSVKISLRRGVPEEQDVAVVGVPWPLPFSQASGPLGVLIAHFQL